MDFKTYTKFWTKIIPSRTRIVDQKVKSIFEIDFHTLKSNGYELIIFDVDDTLDDYLGEVDGRSLQLLRDLHQSGFKVGIFSNSKPKRTKYLHELFSKLNIYNVDRSDKPNSAGYKEIIEHYRTDTAKTIMIGDKIGTDMYGAFNAGIKLKILVEPFSKVFGGRKAKFVDRFIRSIEKFLY